MVEIFCSAQSWWSPDGMHEVVALGLFLCFVVERLTCFPYLILFEYFFILQASGILIVNFVDSNNINCLKMSNHVLKLLSNEANKRAKSPKLGQPPLLMKQQSAPMMKLKGLKKSQSARDMALVSKRLATPYGFSQAKL